MNSDVELVRAVTSQIASHLQDWHLVDDDPGPSIWGMRLHLVHDDDPVARIRVSSTSTQNVRRLRFHAMSPDVPQELRRSLSLYGEEMACTAAITRPPQQIAAQVRRVVVPSAHELARTGTERIHSALQAMVERDLAAEQIQRFMGFRSVRMARHSGFGAVFDVESRTIELYQLSLEEMIEMAELLASHPTLGRFREAGVA